MQVCAQVYRMARLRCSHVRLRLRRSNTAWHDPLLRHLSNHRCCPHPKSFDKMPIQVAQQRRQMNRRDISNSRSLNTTPIVPGYSQYRNCLAARGRRHDCRRSSVGTDNLHNSWCCHLRCEGHNLHAMHTGHVSCVSTHTTSSMRAGETVPKIQTRFTEFQRGSWGRYSCGKLCSCRIHAHVQHNQLVLQGGKETQL